MEDLSALLTSARSLNAHITVPNQPVISRSLEQIENDSRNLLARLPASEHDGRATYLLARANVDAMGLGRDIAEIDTTATFQPLRPLADNDVQGYLRHVHEQTLISTIEENRRETQAEFYRVMEERVRRDWDEQKKKIFEELGGRSLSLAESTTTNNLRKSVRAMGAPRGSTSFTPSAQTHAKMRIYDQIVSELNESRLKGTSYPIVHALLKVSSEVTNEESSHMVEILQTLAKIVDEPPYLPSVEHSAAHALNSRSFERRFARAYLSETESRDSAALRKSIIQGSKQALEEQYDQVVDRSLRSNPVQAQLGGDPSHVNRIRAFVSMRYYKSGRWDDRIELVKGQPEWAKLFYLIRTGHPKEAIQHASSIEHALNQKDASFMTYFKTWIDSGSRVLPQRLKDSLQNSFNSHLLHSASTDPFKLALFKLMGRLDVNKRNQPYVTGTTEDWMWFQLAMVDDESAAGLRTLSDVLLGYGESHFEVPDSQHNARKGAWARVLLTCGMFEMCVEALYNHPDLQVESIHLAIALAYYGLLRVPSKSEASEVDILVHTRSGQPTLNLGLVLSRYVRHFMRSDPKEAMQYVYNLPLSENQGGVAGQEQIDQAWDLTRRIIVSSEPDSVWESLIGGFRPDGSRFNGAIERNLPLLKLKSPQQYNDIILLRAAAQCEKEGKLNEAIKLYNLAGAHSTVMMCLARGLGDLIAEPAGGGEEGRNLQRTAQEVLRHYDRTNRVTGRERDTVVRLLGVREAIEAKEHGRLEAALETLENTDIVPLDGDAALITTRAAEFREQDDAISRNLYIVLPLIMDILGGLHQKIKSGTQSDSSKQAILKAVRKKARALMMFAGTLRYRLSPEVHSYLTRLDVAIAL